MLEDFQKPLDQLIAEGWTLERVRKELDAVDQNMEDHLADCPLCIGDREIYCPMGKRIGHERMLGVAVLLAIGAEEEFGPTKSRKARHKTNR